ncbi:MAG: discoidin domain-containing protein [Actinomycetia bacterium]|nr:discoidin domain-containing protein [Actinomycetes bacterium]
MQGDDPNDQFDELFEPFELDATPPPSEMSGQAAPPTPSGMVDDAGHVTGEIPTQQHVTTTSEDANVIACPSCGVRNPAFNHHCERCGSRLSQDPMPIAASPTGRSSAGGRALGVLAAVVLIVALVALMMNIFRGGDDAALPDTSSTSSTTTQPVIVSEIFPTSAKASSELSEAFGAANLIDGDPETRWNDDGLRGAGAWLEFTFGTPVQITELEFQNVTDNEAFRRNYKIQGYTITVNDLNVPISGRLLNSSEPQRVRVASVDTITLRIDVTTTHLAEPVGENPPFDELALQEIRFFGVEK